MRTINEFLETRLDGMNFVQIWTISVLLTFEVLGLLGVLIYLI